MHTGLNPGRQARCVFSLIHWEGKPVPSLGGDGWAPGLGRVEFLGEITAGRKASRWWGAASYFIKMEMVSWRKRNSRSQVHLERSSICSEFENIVQKESGEIRFFLQSFGNVWASVCCGRTQL